MAKILTVSRKSHHPIETLWQGIFVISEAIKKFHNILTM